MATYEITGPNGKKYRVSGQGSPEEAMKALQQQLVGMTEQSQPQETPQQTQQPTAPAADPSYWGTSATAMDTFTGGLQSKLNAAGGGLIDATVGAIQGDGWNFSDNYDRHLAEQRAQQQQFETAHPGKAALGQGAGMALAVTSLPVFGKGFTGAVKTGAGYGAVTGAGADAESIPERLYNTGKGALVGGTIGAGGYGAGVAAGKGMTTVGRAWQGMRADPQTRAVTRVAQTIEDKYGPQASHLLQRDLADLGPDAMLLDVLGEQGLATGRSAANINPNARETLETSLLGRKAGQNERVVSDIEKAAGLKQGNRASVETMKTKAYDAVRPHINRAYEKARAAGQDIPLDYFSDVLNSPLGEDAFKSAVTSLRNRMAVSGDKAGGNLAVIDEMKKILDSKAEMARRAGDNATADVAGTMAKHLRSQMDALLTGDEYLLARTLRKQAYDVDEAFDAGAALAGRPTFDALAAAKKAAPANQKALAAAYASKQGENLLNRGATEGALGSMSTPAGQEAYRVALGKNSGLVDKALAREKNFNKVARALTGNSTTARQLAEMGASGVGAAATTMAMGYDATTGGVAGLMAAILRKGGPALATKIATSSQREAAPIIAELLTGRGQLPARGIAKPGTLEKLSKADRNKLAKALLTFTQSGQNASPQTNFAKQ